MKKIKQSFTYNHVCWLQVPPPHVSHSWVPMLFWILFRLSVDLTYSLAFNEHYMAAEMSCDLHVISLLLLSLPPSPSLPLSLSLSPFFLFISQNPVSWLVQKFLWQSTVTSHQKSRMAWGLPTSMGVSMETGSCPGIPWGGWSPSWQLSDSPWDTLSKRHLSSQGLPKFSIHRHYDLTIIVVLSH